MVLRKSRRDGGNQDEQQESDLNLKTPNIEIKSLEDSSEDFPIYLYEEINILEIEEKEDFETDYFSLSLAPLQSGYAITLGNLFRRIGLSTNYGIGVLWIKINDALHEYSTIENIEENYLTILETFRSLLLKFDSPAGQVLLKQGNKEFHYFSALKFDFVFFEKEAIYAEDLERIEPSLKFVNPSIKLFSIINPILKTNLSLVFVHAFNYINHQEWSRSQFKVYQDGKTSNSQDLEEEDASVIVNGQESWVYIENDVNPVTKINWQNFPYRFNSYIEKERLVLEIWTNKQISAKEIFKKIWKKTTIFTNKLNKISEINLNSSTEEKKINE